MPSPERHTVTVQAPATVGNFGPGFDAFSLALHGLGDTVTLAPADRDRLTVDGADAEKVPTAWDRNVASVTVSALRARVGTDQPFELHIVKGQPGGSGLGSSASSAGGAALAFHAAMTDRSLTAQDLVLAAGEGESVAAGRHFDDVAAVVLGGLAIVRVRDARVLLDRVQPPETLHLALVVPEAPLRTKDMRAILPGVVPRADVVHNIGNAAALVDAMHRGDVAAIGRALGDRVATPARRERIPYYEAVREAAHKAGAHGVALSGSGPSMVAVTDDAAACEAVAEAMGEAARATGTAARTLVATPEREVMYDAVTMH